MSLRTPYYLIDERRLQDNLEIVRHVRETSGAKAVLALKCFSTWGVFELMAEHLDGTTSSSLYEARLGRERFGKEVHAYSVAWSADELAEVAGLADKVIFNSVATTADAPGGGRAACRSACASTPGSATRISISPIRPAGTRGSASPTMPSCAPSPAICPGSCSTSTARTSDFDALRGRGRASSPTATPTCCIGWSGSAWAVASRSRRPATPSTGSPRCCASSLTASTCRSTSNRARR